MRTSRQVVLTALSSESLPAFIILMIEGSIYGKTIKKSGAQRLRFI